MHSTIPAAGLSAAITLGLLYAMQALIVLQPGAVVEPHKRIELSWVRLPPDEDLRTDDDLVMPKRPIPPPVLTDTPQTEGTEAVPVNVPRVNPVPGPSRPEESPGILLDGPVGTLVNALPVYPIRAVQQGLEGYVIVSLDVGADGGVDNAVVVESSHPVFESAALQAAKRCRFKPRVVDGIPQPVTGLQKIFRFQMEQ